MMSKTASKAERTRNFIIEKTAEVFNKKGFAGTSLSDLTKVTGLTKGSIYGNFDNKEEVALAVFDFNASRMAKQVEEEVNKAESYHDKLLAHAKAYQKFATSPVNRGGCPVLNTATEADDTNGLLKAKVAAVLNTWEQGLVLLIEQGIKKSEFRADVKVRQTALSIIALIEGGVMMTRVMGDSGCMQMVVETIEGLVTSLGNRAV